MLFSFKNTYFVIRSFHRSEIAHKEKIIFSISDVSYKTEDTAVFIIRIDPLKSCPGCILLIQASIVAIQMK